MIKSAKLAAPAQLHLLPRSRDSRHARLGAAVGRLQISNPEICHKMCQAQLALDHAHPQTALEQPICWRFPCARVRPSGLDHHGEISPQCPQPYSPVPYTSARVHIVRFVRVCGSVGRIGRSGFCQSFVTDSRTRRAPRCVRMSRVSRVGRRPGSSPHRRHRPQVYEDSLERVRAEPPAGARAPVWGPGGRRFKSCLPDDQKARLYGPSVSFGKVPSAGWRPIWGPMLRLHRAQAVRAARRKARSRERLELVSVDALRDVRSGSAH